MHTSLQRLVDSYSIEITPKEYERVGGLARYLASGTHVYVTALPGAPPENAVAASRRIAAEGLRPVPHLAARAFPELADVDRFLGQLAEAGVEEALVIAGSLPRPAGTLDSSLQVLRSGLLEHHGISRVGVAGYPEGHPDVSAETLSGTIIEKNAFAAESDLDVYIVTQFCFTSEPYVRWEREIRETGNALPVHPGLPGVTSARALLRFGIQCGVGPSLRVVRKQTRGFARLLGRSTYRPDRLVAGIVEACDSDPGALFDRLHFFPFGGLEQTVSWIDDLRSRALI